MGISCLDTVAVVDNDLVTVAAVAEFNQLNSTALGSENELTRGTCARNIKTCVPAASAVAVVRSNRIQTRYRPDELALCDNIVATSANACALCADLDFFAYRVNKRYAVNFLGGNLNTVDKGCEVGYLVRTLDALAYGARVTAEEL